MDTDMFGLKGAMPRRAVVSCGLTATGNGIVAAGIGLRVIGGAVELLSLP
jgi:hypothetical protein